MPLSVEFKNAMLSAVPPDALSLHTSNPGSSGLYEVVGGSYARKAPTWGASSNGTKSLSAAVTFDVPAGVTVAYVGFWRAGVYYGYIPIQQESFNNNGTLTLTAGTIDLNATASA